MDDVFGMVVPFTIIRMFKQLRTFGFPCSGYV